MVHVFAEDYLERTLNAQDGVLMGEHCKCFPQVIADCPLTPSSEERGWA